MKLKITKSTKSLTFILNVLLNNFSVLLFKINQDNRRHTVYVYLVIHFIVKKSTGCWKKKVLETQSFLYKFSFNVWETLLMYIFLVIVKIRQIFFVTRENPSFKERDSHIKKICLSALYIPCPHTLWKLLNKKTCSTGWISFPSSFLLSSVGKNS